MTTKDNARKVSGSAQYEFVTQLFQLQKYIEGKDFRVAKRDSSNKPVVQKPFHQVTPLFFPVDDVELIPQALVFDFDSDNKSLNYESSDLIEKFLQERRAPYFKSEHGGRSPHIWIILNVSENALKSGDYLKIREYVADGIINLSEVNAHDSCLDRANFTAKRHLIRAPKKSIPEKLPMWEICDEELAEIVKASGRRGLRIKLGGEREVHKAVEIDVVEPVFHVFSSTEDSDILNLEYGEYFSLGHIRDAKKPVLVVGKKPMRLGRQSVCLRRLNSEVIRGWRFSGKVKKKIEKDFSVNLEGDTANELLIERHAKDIGIFYELTSRLTEAFREKVREMDKDKFDEIIDDYVTDGFEYDPKIKMWADSCLIQFTDTVDDCRWMRFRGHTLILKPSSSGCSTVSNRIGKSYSHSTGASMRGYADAQEEHPSLLNDTHLSVMFDEFLTNPPVADDIQNFTQIGEGTSASGGKEIKYKGTPKLSYIGNPETEATSPEEMVLVVDKAMEKLCPSGAVGLGARMGLLILDNKIRPARKNKKKSINFIESDRLKAIAESVIQDCVPECNKIYKDPLIIAWLEEWDDEYGRLVKDIATGIMDIGSRRLKAFLRNHTNAIRHMRGCALELACRRHLQELFLKEYNIEEILQTAKREYELVKSVNLNSMHNLLGWTCSIDVAEILHRRFQSLTAVGQGIVACIRVGIMLNRAGPGQLIVEQELKDIFEHEHTKALNLSYTHWSRLRDKIPQKNDSMMKRLQESLYINFDIDLREEDGAYSCYLQDISKINRLDLGRIGVIGVNGGNGGNPGYDRTPNYPKSTPFLISAEGTNEGSKDLGQSGVIRGKSEKKEEGSTIEHYTSEQRSTLKETPKPSNNTLRFLKNRVLDEFSLTKDGKMMYEQLTSIAKTAGSTEADLYELICQMKRKGDLFEYQPHHYQINDGSIGLSGAEK